MLKDNKKYGSNSELDKLVDDENWIVRAAVARVGYGLDKLINDEDSFVCLTVNGKLKEQSLSNRLNKASDKVKERRVNSKDCNNLER